MKKFFNLSGSSKNSLDSACSHERFSKQALSKQPRLGNQINFSQDYVTIRNQYDVLKTGEAGGFITKDQART